MPSRGKKTSFPWRFYLNRYSAEVIADMVGVRPATVKTWRRKNRIPAKHLESIRSVRKIKPPSKSRLKKILSVSHSSMIAENAGVTVAVARKWKRQGFIPVDHQTFLVEYRKESPYTFNPNSSERDESTENFTSHFITWDTNITVTEASLERLRRDLYATPGANDALSQFSATVDMTLQSTDAYAKYFGSISLDFGGPPQREYAGDIYFRQYWTKREAIDVMITSLKKYMDREITMHSLTLRAMNQIGGKGRWSIPRRK